MGFLKTRKNKQFNYSPRHYQGSATPFKLESKYDKYRKATLDSKGLKGKFTTAWDDLKHNPDSKANRTVLIIVAVLVLAFLFIIDFDLSIFIPA